MFEHRRPVERTGDRHQVLRELRQRMSTVGQAGGVAATEVPVATDDVIQVDTGIEGDQLENAAQGLIGPGLAGPGVTKQSFIGQSFIGQSFIGQSFIGQSFIGQGVTGPGVGGSAAMTADSILPVAAPLAAILPRQGLARGSVVSVLGQGATSLLFTLLAGPQGQWSALVGMPGIGLLAATEFGVDLDRVAVIPEPGPDVLQVLSILMDGVDLIAVALPDAARPAPSRQRVLTGRLRQRGAVLLVMGPWPGADLVLTSRWLGWSGLGQGHGRLRDRELAVQVSGRGEAARGRRAALLLRAGRTSVDIATLDNAALDLADLDLADLDLANVNRAAASTQGAVELPARQFA